MNAILIFQLLVLVAVANAAPVICKKLLGKTFAWPLDFGVVLHDGQPLLGASKTIRGLVISSAATPAVSASMGLGWEIGALVASAAMAGDLLSSFAKRRLGLPPSSRAIGLDQIPESFFPLLAARLLLPVTLLDIAVATAIFFVGELALSRILFKLSLRDKPY